MKGWIEKLGLRRGGRDRKQEHPHVTDAPQKKRHRPENRANDDSDDGPQHFIPIPRQFR